MPPASRLTRLWKLSNRMIKQKKKIAIVSGLLLIVLYVLIFGFSAQDGETSGSISLTVSRYGVALWNRLNGGLLNDQMIRVLADHFEYPLRKAAHFTEYMVMGILVCCLLYTFVESVKKRYFCSIVWIFISAALDELHQYFVPGRWASVADVFLDTCGGAVGAALGCLFLYWVERRIE